ncbi:hypothetical protein J437_LFUL003788 [Ladona fulva]|uniref:C-type lectin domain-containing protein n=1 Tax=Ladona fulva TaxID=123851 RepID=A0A8K0NUR6_LADFU|nr:hypothetical protein J437_LFUL003788 [Ladona fulva]
MCEDEGGHLAVVDSKEEGGVLITLIKKEQTYIGAHDRVTEGKFMTIFGASMGNHIAWSGNQPDNSGGNEHCVTITTSGKLNDVPCTHIAPFICEFDLMWSE